MNDRNVYMRCDDHAEAIVFHKYEYENDKPSYEIVVEDSYCGGDYMGIEGRFKRAWRAFFAKPICFTGIFCDDKDHMKNFLEECLKLVNIE